MTRFYDQEPGTRISRWDLGENPQALIEATGERPVMYAWLGTDPKREHPFNVYGDICSQPDALRQTFDINSAVVPDLAARLIERGYSGAVGYGLGTSQFAPHTSLAAFWFYAGWGAREIGSLEFVGYPRRPA